MRNKARTKRLDAKWESRRLFLKRADLRRNATLAEAIRWNDSSEKFIFITDEIMQCTYTGNETAVNKCVEGLEDRYKELLESAGIEVKND